MAGRTRRDAAVVAALNPIFELELAGVVRHAQDALMILGADRLPLSGWMHGLARDALARAVDAGEELTVLGALPSLRVGPLVDLRRDELKQILRQAMEHGQAVLDACAELLARVEGRNPRLETYARRRIAGQEQHLADLDRLLRRPGRLERVR